MNQPRIPVRPIPLISFPSRRDLLRGLTSAGLALPIARLPDSAAKKKRKRKNKKKVKRNEFGCVNIGGFCMNSDQCCSGICQSKKGKKKCQAHNSSTCTGTSGCGGEFVGCTTVTGADGTCNVTTGNANFCVTSAVCFDCTRDTECEPVCGTGAACLVCAECVPLGLQTACASANEFGCFPV